MADARCQVLDPSVQAVLYQCHALAERLSGCPEREYPPEALRIRDLLTLLVRQVQRRLWGIHQKTAAAPRRPLGEADVEHTVQLGKFVQAVHASLRYVES